MHCITDFTITFELKRYNDAENNWTALPDEEQQGIWRDLDSRHEDIKNFFLEDYGVYILSVIENRKMNCRAYDRERLASFLSDTVGDELNSQLSRKFRDTVSWQSADVTVHLTIADDDYHAGLAYCRPNARTDVAATR